MRRQRAPEDVQRHTARVRTFYDRESDGYLAERYGTQNPHVARPYLERFRLIQELLDVRDCSVLDLGCGPGVLEPYLLERGCRVVAVDLSEKMIRRAREAGASRPRSQEVRFCVARADSLPFGDALFDAVLCIGVISYWPDAARGLEEIARVLRPGGVVLIQASNPMGLSQVEERLIRRPALWMRTIVTGREHRDADFSLRAYLPWRLEKLLLSAGLRPTERRSYDFQVPLLGRLAGEASRRVSGFLMRFNRSRWLGLGGAGYLVKAVRD